MLNGHSETERLRKSFEDFHNKVLAQQSSPDYIGKALEIAKRAHAGQVDKAGKDYFTAHVEKVTWNVSFFNGDVFDLGSMYVVALLHDVIEDTDTTEADLRAEFPDSIVDAVMTMTHREGENYTDYILRIKENPLSRMVKICDLRNNMDISRIEEPTDYDLQRYQKYKDALAILIN